MIISWLAEKKRMQIRVVFAAALFMILFMAAGCENQMQTKRGSVNGSVRDTMQNPIAGAMITSHRSLFKAETDKNGHFEFTSLDVGTHRLSVERNGYYLASKTVEIAYGEVLEGVAIKIEPLDLMISHTVAMREAGRVVIDVSCKEPMAILLGWRERGGTRIQLPPTEVKSNHQIVLTNLFPGSDYLYDLQGTTADGRRYSSEGGAFKAVPYGDIPGAPQTVNSLKVSQGTAGPVLSWNYDGTDPLQGFRVFRGENNGALSLIQNEKNVYATQNTLMDETAIPGRIYRYAMQSVDLDDNISSMSVIISIMPGGKIVEDLVWKKAWGPISINGDLIISAGRTLSIEPGCVIRFAATDAGKSGYRPTMCEMIVEGTLLAEGTEADPIRFISASAVPSRVDWDGIRLVAVKSQQQSVLKYLEISGAERGVTLYDSDVDIQNYTARYCQTGFSVQGASGTVLTGMVFEDCNVALTAENTWYCSAENIKINKCTSGIRLAGNSFFTLSRFEVRNALDSAVMVSDSSSPRLRNGLIQSFQTGLTIGADGGDFQYLTIDAVSGILVEGAKLPTIRNCIIVNRRIPATGNGIDDRMPAATRSYPYNNISGFLQATNGCNQFGGPVINLEPLFVGGNSESYSYQLSAASPILTSSDKNGQPGAYGSDS